MERRGSPPKPDDRLGFSNIIAPLVAQIVSRTADDPPLTIGIFGEWGSGKTRLLRLAEHALQEKDIPVVWFNAWRYANEEHLWVALLQRVMDQIKTSRNIVLRPLVSLQLAVMQADIGAGVRHLTWRTISFVLRLLLFLAILALVLTTDAAEIARRLQPLIGWLPATWQIRLVTGLALIGTFFAANVKELVAVLRGTTVGIDLSRFLQKVPYRERVAFLDQLGPFFRDVIRKAGGGKPVVILIDDLDRCLPDKAVQVLEAIALFLDVDGCVFLIAADRPMIEEAITVRS
jgi:hypothetical protein